MQSQKFYRVVLSSPKDRTEFLFYTLCVTEIWLDHWFNQSFIVYFVILEQEFMKLFRNVCCDSCYGYFLQVFYKNFTKKVQ